MAIAMRIRSVLVALGLCVAFASAAAADPAASAKCLQCHEEQLELMARTAHAVAADKRTPGCTGCHGASTAHADKPTSVKPDKLFSGKSALTANEATGVCMSCHDRDAKRALWSGSPHPSANIACSDCHKAHTNRDQVMSRRTETESCFACHKEQRAQINRPSRHPIAEGKMGCSDCHDVHGTAGPKLAKRDSTNDTCYTCHAEKRGPFVHQHQPVAEDCANCHNPHGSTIAAMLKARPPMLCQQCHTPHVAGGVGAIGGQPGVFPPRAPGQVTPEIDAASSGKNVVNFFQGRSCMNCHTQVHGSNNPAATNPTPQFMFR